MQQAENKRNGRARPGRVGRALPFLRQAEGREGDEAHCSQLAKRRRYPGPVARFGARRDGACGMLFPLHCGNAKVALRFTERGGVSEWLKEAVLKTVVPKGTVGSNPTASASSISQRCRFRRTSP